MNPETIERLIKLLGLLGSAHDGERAAAGLKAHELIKRHGLTWHDLIAPPTHISGSHTDDCIINDEEEWRADVDFCLQYVRRLRPKELAFLHN